MVALHRSSLALLRAHLAAALALAAAACSSPTAPSAALGTPAQDASIFLDSGYLDTPAPPNDAPALDFAGTDAPTADSQPAETKLTDADLADSTAADAPAAETAPTDTAAPDTSTADTSAADAQPADLGAADTAEPPDTLDTAAPPEPDASAADAEADLGPDTPAPPPACTDAPPPGPLAAGPLATQAPAGAVETVQNGAFTDDYLLQGDGNLKIGVRRNWGASIIFYGFSQKPGLNTTNVIDGNDTGREVQVALYDPARAMQGCAYNSTCQSNPAASCPNSITFLGWNPVQGGNECNAGSPIESIASEAGTLTAVVRPNHWNPDWQEPSCANAGCSDPAKKTMLSDVRYTQKLRFVQNNVVEIDMQVDNLAAMDHAVTLQEFPTLYAAYGAAGTPNLNVLLDSTGQAIPIDQPANDGFLFKAFASPGGWASLQNAKQDYGVALYYENRVSGFQGWQKAGVFNNFRSQFAFGLPALGTVHARAYLVIGGFATVKGIIANLDAQLPPFGALDTPATEQQLPLGQNTVNLAGWALDNVGVTAVQARLDGQPWADLPLDTPRPDVCTAWPGYAACQGPVGYAHALTLPPSLGACAHLVEVVATDTHGNSRVIGRTRIFTGGSTPPPPPAVPASHTVFRFTATTAGANDHMFGLSNTPLAGYALEGVAFGLFDGPATTAQPMVPIYQRFCAACTDHMPTMDPGEGSPDFSGADILGYCSLQPTSWAKTKITRIYSAAASDHFLTADAAEVAGAAGYSAEWSCWAP